MAYHGVDPWRWQYFADWPCPPGVEIPIDEASAWTLYPSLRHIHNKLWICESQGMAHAPHGVEPARYPVFSKPIYNLRGMGTGSQVLRSRAGYLAARQPGHLWMTLLTGDHVSTDLALVKGRVAWCRHTTGKPRRGGTFDYWTIHAERRPSLERYLGGWSGRYLSNFTGVVNFETIAGRIIECHLRMAEQWIDLNGNKWLEAVTDLYRTGRWRFDDGARRTGYSVILFTPHGTAWRQPNPRILADIKRLPGVSSIQLTYDRKRHVEQHAMPPGGFRLAIINCWDLTVGRRARRRLAEAFAPD